MKLFFAALLVVHGLIHLMGTATAFRFASMPQLTEPISPAMGVLWLTAALLLLTTAGALFVRPRLWWAIGTLAIVISQWAVVSSWTDARFGSILNLVTLVGVFFGFLAQGPASLRAEYEADIERGLARLGPTEPLTEADLAHLPEPVQRYLGLAGVVGQPKVQNVRVRMHGRIRSGASAPWMSFSAEQYSFFDHPSRLFYMNASRRLVPVQGFHRYVGATATMRVKVAALVPVASASGPEMTVAETVTMFNDMCVFAPATLIDPAIRWEPVDARTVHAAFTHAGATIRAELFFDDAGELVDFRSDDRRQASPDGKTMKPVRWSTPVGDYRVFRQTRLATRGEGRWHEPAGAYAYIQVELDDVQYNVGRR